MLQLRPYQETLVSRVAGQIAAGLRRLLVVLPTGGGKTVFAARLILDTVLAGGSVLFLAHRRELIQQASAKLHAAGVDHGLIQAGLPTRPAERVQVGSVQTLHARAVRSAAMALPAADLVIVDEAHHGRARIYRQILEAYPQATVVGLTATPCRADGRGLGSAFDALVEGPSIAKLIGDGYLVPTRWFAPATPDLDGVAVKRGDYVESQLAQRMNQPRLVGDVVTHWHRLAEKRRTVVFASGVAHSLHLRDAFRLGGVLAEHVDGATPVEERDAILRGLAAGTVDVVCNCAVLTEGWDRPEVSCLVLARPTRSVALYRQMVGRVLRPAEGKSDALILDHAGAVFEHGFVDDPVAWALAPDRRAESAAQRARGQERLARKLAACPECTAVRWEGDPCTVCGWRPVTKPAPVETAEGELAAVDRATRRAPAGEPSLADKTQFYGELLWISRERGYRNGWAAHKHKERFGAWPRGRIELARPTAPRPETRAWVRSRMIAYAKVTARAAQAGT